MDLISLLNSRQNIELKSEEEIVNELGEDHHIDDNHPDPLSLEPKVKCGRVLISADGAYSVECDACNDRFDGMDSFSNHLKTVHSGYGIRKNGWMKVAATEELTFKTEDIDDQAGNTKDRVVLEKAVCRLSENSDSKKIVTNIPKNITAKKNRREVKLPRYRLCSDYLRKPVKITAEPIYDEKRLFCVTCDRQLASREIFTRHKNYHKRRFRIQRMTDSNHVDQEEASNKTIVKDELDIGDYEIKDSVYHGESLEKVDRDEGIYHDKESESNKRLTIDTKFNASRTRDCLRDEPTYFQCQFCNKHFENLTERCLHEESHANEKAPYQCSICSKSFTNKFNRKNHKIIHRGDRPFRCTQCDKTFPTEYYLKRHVQRSKAKESELESYPLGTSSKKRKLKGNISFEADVQSPNQREVAIASSAQLESATKNDKITFSEESNLQKEGIEEGQQVESMPKRRTLFTLEPKFDEERNFCITCDLQLDSQRAFINHKKKHRSSIQRWKTRNGLRLRRKHGKTVFSENPNFDDEKNFCITCNREFVSRGSFRYHKYVHMNLIHPKHPKFFCELCSGQFKSDSGLRDHILANHGDEIPAFLQGDPTYLKCRFCHKEFAKPSERYQHEKSHPKEKRPYQCPLCPKSFKKNSERKMHESIHEKQLEGSTKNEKLRLINKMLVFSENPKFDDEKNFCITCNREFASRGSLTHHKYLHTNLINPKQPTFFCELCPGKFKSDFGLRDHIVANHGDEIPKSLQDDPTYLKCRYCHKQFVKPTERFQHEKSHPKEKKPYQCPLCPKVFAKNSERKIHESTHGEDQPYHCKHCSKSFRYKASFNRHLKDFHGGLNSGNVASVQAEGTTKNEKIRQQKMVVFSKNPNFDEEKNVCITCNIEFPSSISLSTHKLLHQSMILRKEATLRKHIEMCNEEGVQKSPQDDPMNST